VAGVWLRRSPVVVLALRAGLQGRPDPLRVADMPAYLRELGFSAEEVFIRSFQGTPMRHGGVQVGNFFLGEKEGGRQFTDEDEEMLVLFASQAATAIVNARTHGAEQRARADLAALVDTAPVGVVVFNARTGKVTSFNREVKRMIARVQAALRKRTQPEPFVLKELAIHYEERHSPEWKRQAAPSSR